MPIESQVIEGNRTCVVSGDLRIWEAADIWRRLYPMIIDSDPLTVDLTQVNACDGCGVQIIHQFLTIDGTAEKQMSFIGVSDSVVSAMRQAGFTDENVKRLSGEG